MKNIFVWNWVRLSTSRLDYGLTSMLPGTDVIIRIAWQV